jgi:hypothetical protein
MKIFFYSSFTLASFSVAALRMIKKENEQKISGNLRLTKTPSY